MRVRSALSEPPWEPWAAGAGTKRVRVRVRVRVTVSQAALTRAGEAAVVAADVRQVAAAVVGPRPVVQHRCALREVLLRVRVRVRVRSRSRVRVRARGS